MTDQYQVFSNTALGKLVVKNLGLPAPLTLERFSQSAPVIEGAVLFAAAKSPLLAAEISRVLSDIQADSFSTTDYPDLIAVAAAAGLSLRQFNLVNKASKFKALIFDASGIENTAQLQALYDFFHPVARQLQASGRVIVLGTSPETASSIAQAVAQRAIVGFVKSMAKEFKKGISCNLIYVDQGAAHNLDSSLRFLLSPRSAYVSGQVIRITQAAKVEVDWQQPLAGKTAVVTGASRGIGEAIAQVLARDGAKVICLDVPAQQDDLARVAGELSGAVLALDICQADAGEKIKAAAAALGGGVDILVHNAGVTRDKTLANMRLEQWQQVIDINITASQSINQYLLDHQGFNADARIVCVSSISGIAGNLGQSNYATSKAAVIGLVQYSAPHLPDGITINAVAPGFIETKMTAAIPFAIREAGRRMNAMSQGGQPVDVAETIAYFASSASAGLNGNVLRVCGQSLLGA
jgi:3-oxoacyl-[acyl-carrier protein] reductase